MAEPVPRGVPSHVEIVDRLPPDPMRDFFHGLRLAARTLANDRSFTVPVILTLGVALAANTAVFTVVDRVLVRPLDYSDSHRLYFLTERVRGEGRRLPSYPTFRDWQAQARAFDGLAFARGTTAAIRFPDGLERALVAYVTPNFFEVLGARPAFGRLIVPSERESPRADVVVLTHAFWRRRFGGDPSVVGRVLDIDDKRATVIGVLPNSAARYPPWADLYQPIAAIEATDPALASRHHHSDSRTVARLRAGVTRERAIADLATIQARLAAAYPEHGKEWTTANMTPLRDEIVGDIGPSLRVLGGAVMLVLLIAVVNVATLAVIRSSSRAREFAIRSALGARWTSLTGPVITESALVGLVSGALGLVLAVWAVSLLRRAAPAALPRANELAIDARLAALAMVIALITGIVVGLGPAMRAASARTLAALRGGWSSAPGGRRGARLRASLVVSQFALGLLLLVGAGLLLESFRRLRRVDLGFDPEGLLALWVTPPSPKYDAPDRALDLYQRLLDRLASVPGVRSVAVSNHLPLGGYVVTGVVVPGRQPPAGEIDQALYKTVSEGYLGTMRLRVVRGRWFDRGDMNGSTGVVVSETMAKRFWPNEDPVGRPVTVFRSSQMRPGFGDPAPSHVIGVVSDVRHFGLAEDPPAEVYVPYSREVWPHVAIAVRRGANAPALASELRRAVLEVEPDLPFAPSGGDAAGGFEPFEARVSASLASRRYLTWLVVAFGSCALLLAALGVYGVTAYAVSERTREFGVRMALGATPRAVVRQVLGQAAVLAALGVALGLAAALGLGRFVRSVLFGVSPHEPAILAVAAPILLLAAAIASVVPARRAARVDPVVALRTD